MTTPFTYEFGYSWWIGWGYLVPIALFGALAILAMRFKWRRWVVITSTVLAAGQSCTIIVRVQGTALGVHLNTTSQVTATGTPAGGPASATLTVLAPFVASPALIPASDPWQLAVIASLLVLLGGWALRRRAR